MQKSLCVLLLASLAGLLRNVSAKMVAVVLTPQLAKATAKVIGAPYSDCRTELRSWSQQRTSRSQGIKPADSFIIISLLGLRSVIDIMS